MSFLSVIPAQAGIQTSTKMDPRLRGDDKCICWNNYKYFILILFFALLTGCFAKGEKGSASNVQVLRFNALTHHNSLRAMHHAPPLVWDETLAAYAESHALTCRFKHSGGKYGENLAAGYKSISPAITAWYNENELYSYQHPGFSKSTGHFTQLVWKESRLLGCGYAICNGKNGTPGKYYVCEYFPRGNVTNRGYFERNVT